MIVCEECNTLTRTASRVRVCPPCRREGVRERRGQQKRSTTARSASGTARWARVTDKQARSHLTAAARAVAWLKFDRMADPDGVLPDAERERRADMLRRAHFGELGRRSGLARARK